MWTKEKQAEYHKLYRQRNGEKISLYARGWYLLNKEKRKKYNDDNREKIRIQQKERREENKELIKEVWDEWYAKNKERSPKRRFWESKNSAKRRGIEWLLSFDEYVRLIKESCYYCGNKLCKPVRRMVGLDRLDSNLGYEISNVVSCCYVCNVMKNNFLTPEETKVVANALIKYREGLILEGGDDQVVDITI